MGEEKVEEEMDKAGLLGLMTEALRKGMENDEERTKIAIDLTKKAEENHKEIIQVLKQIRDLLRRKK